MFKTPTFFKRHCKMTQYAVFVIAYFATGKLGIFLAVPPGYATAIFPPSGIALAGILLLGYRAWFSVLLGSFLLNLSITASHAPIENYISVVMAFIIAVGATLQAILGAYLVKNFANFPNPLASERNVFKFIFYGGILSTLVNSTISVSTLVAMNQVPVSNFFNNWSTWWLGDAIGIFIFAPLTLVWFYRKHDYFYNRKHTVTFTILSAFLLTVMLVVFETHKESERLKSEFDKGVLTLNRALDKSIAEHLLTLRSLESFYAASGNVERDAFHQFTANTLKEFKGIQALEWCPIIKNAEREAFEKSVQKEGFLNFEITERNENQKLVRAKEREFYAPITFVEPFKSNELTLGYSANINERHEAMEIARDTGDIVTSAKFVLLQSNRVGILVIAPIYKQHLPHDSLQERRQNILGYVQAVFHVDDILQNALKGANFEKLHLELFDENAPVSEHLLFSNQLSTFVLNEKGLFGKNLALTSSTVIPIGNRQWRFKITPTQDYFAYHYSNNAWLILLSGLVLTSVIGVFIMVSSGRELVLQELVNNRTNDLAKSEAHFRSIIEISPVPLALNDNQQNILFLNSTFIRTFGYDLNDIPTLNEWWDKAYPDPNYRQWVLDTWATTLEQCKTENKVFPPLEFVICCKNGMQRTVLISPSALGDSFETHLVVLYDITERKNMEISLRESESTSRKIQNDLENILSAATEVSIISTDVNGLITVFNRGAELMLGYTAEEMIGKKTPAILHDANEVAQRSRELSEEFGRTISGFDVFVERANVVGLETWECTHICKNGSHLTVLLTITTIHNEAGEITGYLGIAEDITERKQIELNLQKESHKTLALLHNASDGISIINEAGNIVECSDSFCTMLGYSREDMMGMHVSQWDVGISKDALMPFVHKAFEQKSVRIEFETKHIRKDGTIYDAEISSYPIEFDGQWVIFCSTRDVTKRKDIEQQLLESEFRWKFAVEGSGDGLWDWDISNSCVFFSKCWKEMIGFQDDEIGNGLDEWEKRIHPNDKEHVVATVQACLEGETSVYVSEHRVRCKDGTYKWLLARGMVVVRDDEGKPLRMIGTHTDITKRKVMETELKRSNSDLEQFAYAISHDMRQPLRMVTSYLSLIEKALDKQLDEDTRQFLDFAVDGAKRMDSMILSLLDYSRVGRNTHAASLISSRAAVDEALLFLQPALESCQGRLEITGDWIELVANRDELTRLFQNLIGNALKYQDGIKTPVVEISASVTPNTFRVDVRDNGIGIEPTQIDRLFKVFSRLQARSHFEGTGVGLALCRKIIEHHGGTIGVESAGEGYGCTFWFELPRKSISDVNV